MAQRLPFHRRPRPDSHLNTNNIRHRLTQDTLSKVLPTGNITLLRVILPTDPLPAPWGRHKQERWDPPAFQVLDKSQLRTTAQQPIIQQQQQQAPSQDRTLQILPGTT